MAWENVSALNLMPLTLSGLDVQSAPECERAFGLVAQVSSPFGGSSVTTLAWEVIPRRV